jgi:hypothetical protein
MRPKYHPVIERLESYTLLSGTAIPTVGLSGFTLPMVNVTGLTEQASAVPAPLKLTLTTDKSVYQVGQTVTMTLTEKNTSNQTLLIGDGPSVDGFFVTQNGATVWRSNAGPQPFFIREISLAPGQVFTLKATWDGHPNSAFGGGELTATPTGTFVVHSQVIQSGAQANTVTITVQSPTPTPTPPPTPVTPSSTRTVSVHVTTDRASYKVGGPVTVTLTETNTGTLGVPVGGAGAPARVSVTGPDGAARRTSPARPRSSSPGRTPFRGAPTARPAPPRSP